MSTDEINRLMSKMDEMGEKIDNLDSALRGNGKDYPGIAGRLDRIEQKEALRAKLAWLGAGLGATALGAWVKNLMNGGN